MNSRNFITLYTCANRYFAAIQLNFRSNRVNSIFPNDTMEMAAKSTIASRLKQENKKKRYNCLDMDGFESKLRNECFLSQIPPRLKKKIVTKSDPLRFINISTCVCKLIIFQSNDWQSFLILVQCSI